jgi:hypothetical protein
MHEKVHLCDRHGNRTRIHSSLTAQSEIPKLRDPGNNEYIVGLDVPVYEPLGMHKSEAFTDFFEKCVHFTDFDNLATFIHQLSHRTEVKEIFLSLI